MTHTPSDPVPIAPQPAQPVAIQPGPGVVPPFVAPPREGVKRRRWVGVGIGVAIAVLCCGGGGAGFFGLLVTIKNQRFSDAQSVVTQYMTDKQGGHFAAAYQLLCIEVKREFTLSEFTSEVDETPILDFDVQPAVQRTNNLLVVPVDVDYAAGGQDSLEYAVTVDADGGSRLCGGSTSNF